MLRLLSVLVLVLTFGVGNAWADYTIGFATSGSSAIVSGNDYVSNATLGGNTYIESNGLRFGKSGATGSITVTLTSSGTYIGQVQASKITLKSVLTYNTDSQTNGVKTTITYTDNTTKEDLYTAPSTATDHDITLTSTKTIKSVKIESTTNSKRFYCKGFTVVTAAATPRTVSWKCNGLDWESGVVTGNTTVNSGSKISAVPTAPTTSNCDNSKVFVGWTATENYSNASTAPTDLFTDVTGSPTISTDVTFYAVFADAEDSESTTTFTFNGTILGTGGYKDTDFEWMGLDFKRSQMYYNNSGAQVAKTNNGFWNVDAFPGAIKQIKVTATQNAATLYTGASAKATTSSNSISIGAERTFDISTSNNYRYFYIKSGSSYTVITTLKVTYLSKTYSNYVTTCCSPLGSINGSVSWTNSTTSVV